LRGCRKISVQTLPWLEKNEKNPHKNARILGSAMKYQEEAGILRGGIAISARPPPAFEP
jgi:hypothetical protein